MTYIITKLVGSDTALMFADSRLVMKSNPQEVVSETFPKIFTLSERVHNSGNDYIFSATGAPGTICRARETLISSGPYDSVYDIAEILAKASKDIKNPARFHVTGLDQDKKLQIIDVDPDRYDKAYGTLENFAQNGSAFGFNDEILRHHRDVVGNFSHQTLEESVQLAAELLNFAAVYDSCVNENLQMGVISKKDGKANASVLYPPLKQPERKYVKLLESFPHITGMLRDMPSEYVTLMSNLDNSPENTDKLFEFSQHLSVFYDNFLKSIQDYFKARTEGSDVDQRIAASFVLLGIMALRDRGEGLIRHNELLKPLPRFKRTPMTVELTQP